MHTNEFSFTSRDELLIHVYEWLPDKADQIRGVLQISHGMAEHGGRYENFANYLTDNGFAVYANDHRGHGKTAGDLDKVGVLDPKDGWDRLVADIIQLTSIIKEKQQGVPVFLFGHSMGSFAVRKCICMDDPGIQGAIISGTGDDPGILGKIGILLTSLLMVFYPASSPSPFMDSLSFGAFNKPFKPNRTKFDWLSRDNEQVDKYVADPYCGGIFSLGFFKQMLKGLLFVSKQENINKISNNLSILLFSGEKDPVGGNGNGVKAVYHKFKKAGIESLTFKLFPDGRHEMLNELNREEVYEMVLSWLTKELDDSSTQ